jgi:hypothetical protein
MSEAEFDRKTAELEGLLNDPEVRLDAHRVWALAQELKAVSLPLAGYVPVQLPSRKPH